MPQALRRRFAALSGYSGAWTVPFGAFHASYKFRTYQTRLICVLDVDYVWRNIYSTCSVYNTQFATFAGTNLRDIGMPPLQCPSKVLLKKNNTIKSSKIEKGSTSPYETDGLCFLGTIVVVLNWCCSTNSCNQGCWNALRALMLTN